MSIKNAGHNVWTVRVTLGTHPVTGKRVQRQRTVRGSRDDARAVEAELEAMRSEYVQDTGRMRLARFIEELWLPSLENSPATIHDYTTHARRYVIPALGRRYLDEVDVFTIEQYLKSCKTRSIARKSKAVLSVALGRAVSWGFIRHNPVRDVKSKHAEQVRRKPQSFSVDEVNQILAAFHGSPIEPGILVATFAGLRREEVMGLDWQDIDLRHGTITVRDTVIEIAGKAVAGDGKNTFAHRTVPITGYALDRLRELGTDRVGPILVSKGKRMHPRTYYDAFRRGVTAAGIPYRSVNTLRHTFATLTLSTGVDVGTLSRMMGHAQVSTTLDNYVRPVDEQAADASRKLDGLIVPLPDRRMHGS